jgi:L-alanine-DL-glutamate epimerase-like enolase superfamily enzyme
VPIILDFNCSANDITEVLEQVAEISPHVSVAAVEQPFAPGNVAEHAALARMLGVPLSLDEGVRSQRDLVQIVRYRAAQVVCVKPARVGGLANARTLVVRARELGLSPYLGGFFESPFARGVHRLLAEHCVSEPSDLATVALEGSMGENEVVSVEGGFGLAPSPEVLKWATLIATPG